MSINRFLVALAVIATCSLASAQAVSKADLRQYMLDNNAHLRDARAHFGLLFDDVADVFGYEGFDGYQRASRESALVFAECVRVFVQTRGSADVIGLRAEVLQRHLNLRRANDLGFMARCEESESIREAWLSFVIWTEGSGYPVAFHFSVRSTVHLLDVEGFSNINVYEAAALGFGNEPDTRTAAESTITDFVRSFAETLLNMRE